MNWYYVDANGQQAGPVDDGGLDALAAGGTINAETLVWAEGMANWQSLREVRPSAAAVPVAAQVPETRLPAATGIEEAVCAECGGIFPITETIRVGSNRVCAKCKPIFVQKMREGVNMASGGAFQYAGFWTRFGAVFLDGILLQIVNSAVKLAFGIPFVASARSSLGVSPLVIIGVAVFQICLAVGYETIMIGKYGATLGKMACKIHVVVADGSQVTYARALGRYFAKLISGIICAIGYIMAGFDEEKRALHDRICNTRVVFK